MQKKLFKLQQLSVHCLQVSLYQHTAKLINSKTQRTRKPPTQNITDHHLSSLLPNKNHAYGSRFRVRLRIRMLCQLDLLVNDRQSRRIPNTSFSRKVACPYASDHFLHFLLSRRVELTPQANQLNCRGLRYVVQRWKETASNTLGLLLLYGSVE